MCIVNENDKEGWLSSALVRHTLGNKLEPITRGEGLILKHARPALFGNHEFTVGLDFSKKRNYDHGLLSHNPQLIAKLKRYRRCYARRNQNRVRPIAFHEVLLTGKFSKMFRKLNQKYIDGKIRGPPSYFTRLKQGFALPPLKDYIDGYNSIFSLDMPLKTRETNFLILNSQICSEQKAFYLCPEKGGGVDQNCKLCGDTENTEHLIFACPEYSAMVWETFASAGDKMVNPLTARWTYTSAKKLFFSESMETK
jgi:hypothetical protein